MSASSSNPSSVSFFKTRRRGREVLSRLSLQRSTDELDLLRNLVRRSSGRPFVEESGNQIGETGLVGRVVSGSGLHQGMDLDDRQRMLFLHQYRESIRHDETYWVDICRLSD